MYQLAKIFFSIRFNLWIRHTKFKRVKLSILITLKIDILKYFKNRNKTEQSIPNGREVKNRLKQNINWNFPFVLIGVTNLYYVPVL